MKGGDSDDANMDGPISDDADGSDGDITKVNDAGTYYVESADNDIADADSNAYDDADADNSDAIPNTKGGVRDDIYDNDDVTDKNNLDIDDPDYISAQHELILYLVWSSVALLN